MGRLVILLFTPFSLSSPDSIETDRAAHPLLFGFEPKYKYQYKEI